MATYLQGVTDYIPQIQPFKPDLNFYQGVLETKQAQYKQGYDKLSSLYGTLLNSELTRSDNTERRDKFFNQIQTDIQKVSGMDLSRSENVDAARKVFQPLVDDKFILKDMSFTKAYRDEQGKAEYYMNCTDEKTCGGRYWEGGVRALDYQRNDFSKASIEESMGYQNPTYTPYVDVYKKAMAFAKDMGFNIKTIDWTKDGKYIVKTKNGPAMITSLTDSFINMIAGDPQAKNMYKTQAYLDRKDFIQANAGRYNNDEGAAEKEYLFSQAKEINTNMQKIAAEAAKQKEQVKTTKKVADESVKKTPIHEDFDQAFVNMLNGLPAEEANANSVEQVATEALDNTNGIDYQNMSIQALRQRIDTAKGSQLLYSDMSNAARDYSMNTMEQEVEADKYALASFEHQLKMSEIGYTQSLKDASDKKSEEKKKKEEEEEQALLDLTVNENGIPVTGGKGQVTDKEFDMNADITNSVMKASNDIEGTKQTRNEYLKSLLNGIVSGTGYTQEQKQKAQEGLSLLNSGNQGDGSILGKAMALVKNNFKVNNNEAAIQQFINTAGGGLFRDQVAFMPEMRKFQSQIEQSTEMYGAISQVEKENNLAVKSRMIAEGTPVADANMLIDNKGNMNGISTFKQKWNATYGNNWVIHDEDDGYDDTLAKFKSIYNGGKVPIKSQYGTLDASGQNALTAKNTQYTLDFANLKSPLRADVKELYTTDIAQALGDPAFGNAKFVNGDLKDLTRGDLADIKVGDENYTKAQNVLNEFLRSALTSKYDVKDENRPVIDITKFNVVGNDPNKVGVTFTINQAFAKKYAGSAKDGGYTSEMSGMDAMGMGGNKISVVFDKSAVKSKFFRSLDVNPVEYIFNSKGSIDINSYADIAGTAKITNNNNGYYTINSDLKYFNEQTGRLETLQGEDNPINGIFGNVNADTDINATYAKTVAYINDVAIQNTAAKNRYLARTGANR
jgi:hypothetical protein